MSSWKTQEKDFQLLWNKYYFVLVLLASVFGPICCQEIPYFFVDGDPFSQVQVQHSLLQKQGLYDYVFLQDIKGSFSLLINPIAKIIWFFGVSGNRVVNLLMGTKWQVEIRLNHFKWAFFCFLLLIRLRFF